jgi:HD superfamily phosphodiesterase
MFDSSIRRTMKKDNPAWLTELQNEMALQTAQEAQKLWPHPETHASYFNYRLEHVQQVERDAFRILNEVKVDVDILLAAIWAHDLSISQAESPQHAHVAAEWVRANLAGLGFPARKVAAVAFAVERHADLPGTLPDKANEARVLWDADKLTRLGPLNIVNHILGHAAFPDSRITYAGIAVLGLEQLERSRRIVEDFYYQSSRQIGLQRYMQQKVFYEELAQDVDA